MLNEQEQIISDDNYTDFLYETYIYPICDVKKQTGISVYFFW